MAWLAHTHGPGLGPKPTPSAGTAGLGLAQLREFFSDGRVVSLQPSTRKVGKNALKGLLLHHTSATVQWVAQGQAALPRPMQQEVLDLGRQGFIRGVEVNALLFGKALQNGPGKGIALVPARNGPRGERQVRELHNSLGIEAGLFAQAVTGGAGPCWGIEREQVWLQWPRGVATVRAGQVWREAKPFSGLGVCGRLTDGQGLVAAKPHGGLQRFAQPLPTGGLDLESVDHHPEADGQVARPGRHGIQDMVLDGAVSQLHLHPNKALGTKAIDDRVQVAGLPRLNGGQQADLGLCGLLEQLVHHLGQGLGGQSSRRVLGAARRAGPGKQEAKVVGDFRHGAHGGPGVVVVGLLLDGNGR